MLKRLHLRVMVTIAILKLWKDGVIKPVRMGWWFGWMFVKDDKDER